MDVRNLIRATLLTGLLPLAAEASRFRPFYQGARALGMGDAYTAYAKGYEGVFYNPAGVAKPHKPSIKVLDIEAQGTLATASLGATLASNLGNMQAIFQEVAANPGSPYALGLGLTMPHFIMKNFSIGAFARSYVEAIVDSTTADMNMFAYTDAGAHGTFGFSLFGGIIKIGAGVKLLDRAEISTTFTAAEYTSGSVSFGGLWQEGLGVGFDAGIILTYPGGWLPALGIAVTDILGTSFAETTLLWTGSTIPGAPNAINRRINVGFSINPKHAKGVSTLWTVEVKNVEAALANLSGVMDNFHAGFEFNFRDLLFLRAGLNQGAYWTAGMGVHVGGVQLEFVTFGEDLNYGTGLAKQDVRKYMGRYVLSF